MSRAKRIIAAAVIAVSAAAGFAGVTMFHHGQPARAVAGTDMFHHG